MGPFRRQVVFNSPLALTASPPLIESAHRATAVPASREHGYVRAVTARALDDRGSQNKPVSGLDVDCSRRVLIAVESCWWSGDQRGQVEPGSQATAASYDLSPARDLQCRGNTKHKEHSRAATQRTTEPDGHASDVNPHLPRRNAGRRCTGRTDSRRVRRPEAVCTAGSMLFTSAGTPRASVDAPPAEVVHPEHRSGSPPRGGPSKTACGLVDSNTFVSAVTCPNRKRGSVLRHNSLACAF